MRVIDSDKKMGVAQFIFIGVLVGVCIGAIFALFIFLNVVSFGVPFWSMLIIGGACGFVAAALGWMAREIKLISAQSSDPRAIGSIGMQSFRPTVCIDVLSKLSGHTANMMLNDAFALDIHSLALILGENEGGKIQLPASFVQHCLCFNQKKDCDVVNQVLVEWAMKKNKIKYEKFDKAIILKEMSDSDFKKFQDDLNTVIKVNACNPDYSVISIVDCPENLRDKIGQIKLAVQSFNDRVIGNIEAKTPIEINALVGSVRQSLKMNPGQSIASWLMGGGNQASDGETASPKSPIVKVSVVGGKSFSGAVDTQMDRAMVHCYSSPLGVLSSLGSEINRAINEIENILGDSFCNLPAKHMLVQRVLCRKGKLDPSNPEAILVRYQQITQMAAYFNQLKRDANVDGKENRLSCFEGKLQELKDNGSCIEGMSDVVSKPWQVLSEIKECVLGGGKMIAWTAKITLP